MRQVAAQLAAGVVLAMVACAPKPGDDAGSPASFASDRISVVTRGNGPDIILIPGLTSHRNVWDSVAGQLDDRYRLHLVQVNGFAGTAPGANADGPVSAPVAEEIARYITEAKLSKPAVIGHSMGGTIGMMLAARHPDLVGRLMVVDMPPFMGQMFGPPDATAETVRPIADTMRAQMLAAPSDSFARGFGQMISNMTRKVGMREGLQQSVRASDQRTVANAFYELIVTDLRPEIGRITAPLTVLYVIPPNPPLPPEQFDAAMRASYANAPGARLLKIEDSYHFIQFDQPERLIAEVDNMMRG
jgi:pimeloyl-ACP methyl ester carboxylesterase